MLGSAVCGLSGKAHAVLESRSWEGEECRDGDSSSYSDLCHWPLPAEPEFMIASTSQLVL